LSQTRPDRLRLAFTLIEPRVVIAMLAALRLPALSQAKIYADCTPGKHYCGGGSSFTNPVVDVDYRHSKKSFVAAYCDDHVEVKTCCTLDEWGAGK
jgi:hypothetical protein